MHRSGSQSDLALYLRRIGVFPILTAEDERRLAWRILNDADDDARQRLAQCNLRLVVSVAKRYSDRRIPLMDLIADGNLALLTAVDRFDPAFGVRFSTYAVPWIRRGIHLAIVDRRSLIRVPFEQRANALRMVSIDTSPIAGLRFAGRPSPMSGSLERLDFMAAAERAIESVDPMAARVLRLRLGLTGMPPMSYRRIGEAVGLSGERVRQIGTSALTVLRERLVAER